MVKRPLCILCCIFLTAVMLALLKSSVWEEEKAQQVTAVGKIYYREESNNSSIFYLKDTYLSDGSWSKEPKRLIIYLSKDINYPIGTILKTEGMLYPLEAAGNPGQMDARIYYSSKGIQYRMYGKSVKCLHAGPENVLETLRECLLVWKEHFCRRLDLLFEKDASSALKAMLFGVTADISEELEGQYQLLGVGHLLAISGLHISILGGTVYRFSRKRGVSFWAAACFSGAFLFCYQEMLGFRCSALRAIGMFAFFLGAEVLGRAYDRITALTVIMAGLAAVHPMLLKTGGFWMSGMATFGAALGLERKEAAKRENRKEQKNPSRNDRRICDEKICDGKICDSVEIVGLIQLMTLPLQLFFYYELAVYGIFWNLLLVPVSAVVLGSGIAAIVCSCIWIPAGVFAGGMAQMVLNLYSLAGAIGEKLPGAVYITGRPEVWQVFLYYICFFLWLWNGWPERTKKREGRGGILYGFGFAVSLIFLVFVRFHAPLEVSFLDVGQGDCAVIREEGGLNILVDGGSSDVDQVWKYRMVPFLKYQKIAKLDYVFVSHGDEDHISGLLELFSGDEIPVRYLVCYASASEKLDGLKAAASKKGTEILEVYAGKTLSSETMKICCLAPEKEAEAASENDQSLVFLLESRGVRLLFTGDMEAEEERQMLKNTRRDLLDADILKVAHHGSDSSSSTEMLEAVTPELAVISCGKENRYGHPHEALLERLENTGCDIALTMEQGAVIVKVKHGKWLLAPGEK